MDSRSDDQAGRGEANRLIAPQAADAEARERLTREIKTRLSPLGLDDVHVRIRLATAAELQAIGLQPAEETAGRGAEPAGHGAGWSGIRCSIRLQA